eukprot:TRINITY_DN2804_c0_g2_i1.p1 TRINITY_DN2804_c0_g2~~TRINITY_DN2804_c0_g2_i1.p1  ORF type:complete len:368 (+),score=63.86 TRINITY_DN2804_c0_g2_i1:381-1484(+)
MAVVRACQFDSSGALLACGDNGGRIAVFDYDSFMINSSRNTNDFDNAPILSLNGPRQVESLRWNPNNRDELACAFTFPDVHLFDLQTCQDRATSILKCTSGASIVDIVFVAGRNVLVGGARDGSAKIWDVRAGQQPRRTLPSGNRGTLTSLTVASDDHLVVTSCDGGVLETWDLRYVSNTVCTLSVTEQVTLLYPTAATTTRLSLLNVLLVPDMERLAVCALSDGSICVMDLMTRQLVGVHVTGNAQSRAKPCFMRAHPALYVCANANKVTTLDPCTLTLDASAREHLTAADATAAAGTANSRDDLLRWAESGNGEAQSAVVFETVVGEMALCVSAHPRCDWIAVGRQGPDSVWSLRQKRRDREKEK